MIETAILRAAPRPLARRPVSKGPLPAALGDDSGSLRSPVELEPEAYHALAAAADNDDALADFASGPPPLLTLDDKGGLPVAPEEFYRDVIEDAVEILGAIARRRYEGPWAERAGEERRLLGVMDAILATGEGSEGAIGALWQQATSSPDPWKTWACAFALASTLGADALSAITAGLEEIPATSLAHAALAAEAISLVPRPDARDLEDRLASSSHPVCRAALLDIRARRAGVESASLAKALSDPDLPLIDAGLRLLDRSPESYEPVAEQVHSLLAHPNRVIAWRAARALTLRGDMRPFQAVLAGDSLASRLGPFALELFVLTGKMDDLRAMDRVVSAMKPSPAILSAIARFGHPRAFSFLTSPLQDAALSEAAANALETLFGEIVPRKEKTRTEAWSRAVSALGVDPDSRLRRGVPWSPAVLGAEIQSGMLSRTAISARADELRCRAGLSAPLDLGAWGEDATVPLDNLVRAALSAGEGKR